MHRKLRNLLALTLLLHLGIGPLGAAQEISPAEQALFVTNQFGTLRPPATLRYHYRKSGTLEDGFEDKASIGLRAMPGGACCIAVGQFLSGSRNLALPDVESAQGNPIILYFLERDIHEMQRLTRGKANYFRKRIRMAVYQGAEIRPVILAGPRGPITGQQITITPYADDPLRNRFETLAPKQYVFTLSDGVPGGVFSIRTQVDGAGRGSPPLLVEELSFEALAPAPPARQP